MSEYKIFLDTASKTIEEYCGVIPELVREGYRNLSINFKIEIDQDDYGKDIEKQDIQDALDRFFTENNIFSEVETQYIAEATTLKGRVKALEKENKELQKYKNYFDLTKKINGVS